VSHITIVTDEQLQEYCGHLAECSSIAFDTEFVSESTYYPVLCLVQVAAGDTLALIDATTIEDMTPFWQVIAAEGHETIVHAGRGEIEFCHRAVGRQPAKLFDIQLAAGFMGIEYPAGFGKLLQRLLGLTPNKAETRTDWRRRPLSERQIEYALDDARYLTEMRNILHDRLEELGRLAWIENETAVWQEGIELYLTSERWRRVSGNSGLSRRSLAIVRELWRWRDAEAARRNRPAKRVLRDDLIIELAKRRTAEISRIKAVRGMDRGDLKRFLPQLAESIERGLELPQDELPEVAKRQNVPHLSVLGQFLFSAVGCICRQLDLAPALVGTPSDIRELVAYQTGAISKNASPRLAQGWRAEVIGKTFDDLLAGKVAIRIDDPTSDNPLVFEPWPQD
jgi:ribonuclease D